MHMVKGDIVLIAFPFSDLAQKKIRPALVLSNEKFHGNDVLLCGISSKKKTKHDVTLVNTDLMTGKLPVESYVRNGKITYADKSLILKVVGHISKEKQKEVLERLDEILE